MKTKIFTRIESVYFRFALCLVAQLTIMPVFAITSSGKMGDSAQWLYNSSDKTLTISGTGTTYDGNYSYNAMYVRVPERGRTISMSFVDRYATSFSYGAAVKGDAYSFTPDDVRHIVVNEGITSIGDWAFAFFHNVQSVSLPSSLTRIGGGAFLDDTCLTSITIPNNVTEMKVGICKHTGGSMYGSDVNMGIFEGTRLTTIYWNAKGDQDEGIVSPFYGVENTLKQVILSDAVQYIPMQFCENCTGLTGEMTITKNVKGIGSAAFKGCRNITKINFLADSATIFTSQYMYNSKYEQFFYTRYLYSPFVNCAPNLHVFIGKNVKLIDDFMFSNMYMREASDHGYYSAYYYEGKDTITIQLELEEGSQLETIGRYAFAYTSGFNSFQLPSTVHTIAEYAFYHTDLTEVSIPENVSMLGTYAFSSCPIRTIRYNAMNAYPIGFIHYTKTSGDNMYEGLYGSAFVDTDDTLNVIIGKNVRTIPDYFLMKGNYKSSASTYDNFFSFKERLEYINVTFEQGNKLKRIGEAAFALCSNLAEMQFPTEGDFSISGYAFCRTKHRALKLTPAVSRVSALAFDNCQIDTVYLQSPNINTYVFALSNNNKQEQYEGSPFTNCNDNIVFNIGKEVNKIPDYFCSRYSLKDGELRASTNHFTINWDNRAADSDLSIGTYAFAGNQVMTELFIPSNVSYIKSYAWFGCSNIERVIVHDESSDNSLSLDQGVFHGMNKLHSIVWNAKNAYGNFDEQQAPFYDRAAYISDFTFGNNVEEIPAYLCSSMSSLRYMCIPSQVSFIGDKAFNQCLSIDTFRVEAELPATLGNNVFPSKYHPIMVPCNGRKQYLANESWNQYSIVNQCSPSKYLLTATANNPERGSVSTASAMLIDGEEILIYAEAEDGYAFSGWEDGNMDNPRKVVARSNKQLVANFISDDSLKAQQAAMVEATHRYVQIYQDGHTEMDNPDGIQPVDLGLSVLWADRNLGAISPSDAGNLYAWGDVSPKTYYSDSYYQFYAGDRGYDTYCTLEDHGIVDNKSRLEPKDDAATYNLGRGWRLPTKAEIKELIYCQFSDCTMDDIVGRTCTGITNQSIFFPYAGWKGYDSLLTDAGIASRLWSSDLYANWPDDAHCMIIDPRLISTYHTSSMPRVFGFSIRPVCERPVIQFQTAQSTNISTLYPFYGDTIIVEAIANSDNTFVCWSDGNTENPRNVIVTNNQMLSPLFSDENINGLPVIEQTYTTQKILLNNHLYIRCNNRLYDIMGNPIPMSIPMFK